jgi:hypothetical protein
MGAGDIESYQDGTGDEYGTDRKAIEYHGIPPGNQFVDTLYWPTLSTL